MSDLGFILILFSTFHFIIESHCDQDLERPGLRVDGDLPDYIEPCEACKTLANSFFQGMIRTARQHFGGGDTAWEEKNLGTYANSETRLIEIQEYLCEDKLTKKNKARDACLTLAELWETHLEKWWFHDRRLTPDLKQYLCFDSLKICKNLLCPPGFMRMWPGECKDLDECVSSPCEADEYCVNTEGSYSCRKCDTTGPNNCKGLATRTPKLEEDLPEEPKDGAYNLKTATETAELGDDHKYGKKRNFTSVVLYGLVYFFVLVVIPIVYVLKERYH